MINKVRGRMNRSGGMKVAIVVGVIVIVVVATFIYGNVQRNKQKSAGTPNNLPTIQNNEQTKQAQTAQPQNQNQPATNKPAESNSSPSSPPSQSTPSNQTAQGGAPSSSAGGTAQTPKPTQPQIPAAKTPATGATDTIIPALVLGVLGGTYIIVKRQKRLQTESLQSRSNQI